MPNLSVVTKLRTDGYLYATIRNGGPLMPPQGYRIPPAERWDMVVLVRYPHSGAWTVALVTGSPRHEVTDHLGFDQVYLHNVGRNQAEFIEVFGTEVLPALRLEA